MFYFYIYSAASDVEEPFFSTSDFIAFLAVLISIATPIITHFFSKRSSVKETFWMREVLIPQFSNILFDFIKVSPDKLTTSQNMGAFYNDYALNVINSLKDASRILGVSSKELNEDLDRSIEYFEDEIMNITSVSDRDSYVLLLGDFARKVVSSIQKAQFGY
ncbi:hypothetical protein H4F50_20940 [Pectobacterium brasiliense]|uniref:hypothetical protein n=1 Tax=Pectobacterium brasiliense TaxID=180957 RepID=UPI0019699004|nr:hypothetical protein [Pectobacterium brasiliense]MBN3104312.1 hypothetical protein [Pectobacterium brasiliense]